MQIDNVSGKEVKDIKAVLIQEVKFHGVYKPPKKKIQTKKKAKGKKKGSLLKKTKVRPERPPEAIKKTKTVSVRKAEQLIGTAGGNDTKTFENIEFGIPEVPSTHVDADGIGIGYFIMIEVHADVLMGTVTARTPVIIGNIPHKAAYREWASENMYEMSEKVKEAYPDLPNYNGEKYIFYETAKVKEAGEVVEDAANEKDPLFEDEELPSDSDSSDDSSDSDDGGGGD